MSSGMSTLLKILGAAAVIAIVVLTLTGLIPTWINDTWTWFKTKIGMGIIIAPDYKIMLEFIKF